MKISFFCYILLILLLLFYNNAISYELKKNQLVNIDTNGEKICLKSAIKKIKKQVNIEILLGRNVTGEVKLKYKNIYYEEVINNIAKECGYNVIKEGKTYIIIKLQDYIKRKMNVYENNTLNR